MFTSFLLLAAVVCNFLVPTILAVDDTCFANPQLQKANFRLCQGNQFEVFSVNISTLYNTKTQRHALFKGDTVQLCISGRSNGDLSHPVPALQNSVHGSLRVKIDLPLLGNLVDRPVDSPFCDIQVDGCSNLTPPCQPQQAVVPGQDFCFCSTLQVPTWSPEVDEVNVTWKILSVPQTPNSCESTYSVDELRSKGKDVLVCLQIPAMVRDASKKPQNG